MTADLITSAVTSFCGQAASGCAARSCTRCLASWLGTAALRALLHHTAEALTSYGGLGVAEGMLDRLLSRGNGSLPAAGSGSDVVA